LLVAAGLISINLLDGSLLSEVALVSINLLDNKHKHLVITLSPNYKWTNHVDYICSSV